MERLVTRGEVPVLQAGGEGSKKTLEGYAAVYNKWIERWDGYREMDRSGLFDVSLRSDPRVVLKFDHAGAYAATWNETLSLRSDDYGLFFTARVNLEDPLTKSVVVRMEDGLLREASVAFYVDKEEEKYSDDGGRERVITQGDLDRGDVSVCLYGANEDAWSGLAQMLETPTGQAVLRSLGYSEPKALPDLSPVSTERAASVEELREELVDATSEAELTSDLWTFHSRLRLLKASA